MNNCIRINDTHHFYQKILRKYRDHPFLVNLYKADIKMLPIIQDKLDQLESADMINQKFYKNLYSLYVFYYIIQEYYVNAVRKNLINKSLVTISNYEDEIKQINEDSKTYDNDEDIKFSKDRLKEIDHMIQEHQNHIKFIKTELIILCPRALAMLRWFIAMNCINKGFGILGDEINK